MPLASCDGMTRMVRLVLCSILVFLAGAGVGETPITDISSARTDARGAYAGAREPGLPSVRLEEELVHARTVTAAPAPVKPSAALRRAALKSPRGQAKPRGGALRVLFGDGTHRPQPFPRPAATH